MFNDIINVSHSNYGNITAIRETEPEEFSTIYASYHACPSHKNLQITSSYKKMEKLPANLFGLLTCVLALVLSSVSAVTDDPQDKQVRIAS